MSLLSRLAVQAARAYGMLVGGDSTNVSADYLVVAGGGAGSAGGGGAGGLLTSTATLSLLTTYTVTVGAGGSAGSNVSAGTSGSNSIISGTGLSTITATGGGRGGIFSNAGGGANNGVTGGSGGGGGNSDTGYSAGIGAAGTSGQGNSGGNGTSFNTTGSSGGGGGAGAVGGNGVTSSNGGAGGVGLANSISGSSVFYAGGGSGGGSIATAGGNGGGGQGGGSSQAGSAGTANTGGGGGGAGNTSVVASGAGGSGIVIISYTSATPKFVGGTITTSGGKQIHTFTSSGTLSPITPITANFLVVAGGGGAGDDLGGAGGAGGFRTSAGTSGGGGSAESALTLYSGATYVVTVGAGGAGATSGGANGTNGGNSSIAGTGITTLTSVGGGGGAGDGSGGGIGTAQSGGSGGGAASGSGYAGGAGTANQGYAGGTNPGGTYYGASAGGGGAGAAGTGRSGSSATGGNGGNGVQSSISGTATYYAGGGSGGTGTSGTSGTPGLGGGGQGRTYAGSTVKGGNGQANTGGGGGGGTSAGGDGGDGGSGIVIISYAGSQVFNGGLVTTSGGNTIHTFTSTGALTPLTNNLNNSLRFRSSASAYLSRTFASTGTNNKIQTFSAWVKRGLLSSSANYRLMGCYNGSSSYSTEINFSNDSFRIEFGGSAAYELKTTQVFRDPSAWYHFVIAIDTTQATAANRIKMYVNGNQITAFATANYPAQNDSSQLGSATANNKIGANWNTSGAAEYFDGYMTDINFIDGQALEPYYFGNNDANGVWKPIQYKGTYGTNGFYLTFGNTTSTTTLGYDSSPNGNNWTCNNISLTAGTTYDAMTDVPTNTSATVANYAVINPLPGPQAANIGLITNANLSIANNAGANNMFGFGSIGITSDKYYWEVTVTGFPNANTNTMVIGICAQPYDDPTMRGYSSNGSVGQYFNGTSYSSYGASYTTNDIIGVAFDATNQTIEFFKNGTSQGQKTSIGTSGITEFPWIVSTSTPGAASFNFGQRPFSYTPPTGYVALNTYNLPTPTILQGNKYMDATTYTGTGTSQVIVNQAQFKPDLVWTKSRNAAYNNKLWDSVRGVTKTLDSNATDAESTVSNGLTAFNSNGMTLGGDAGTNTSSTTYVGWQWQAGQGSTSSNTSGSITSTVSVNTTAGFSIATYTGNGSAGATIGHGLGVAPKFIIIKKRSSTADWDVYHSSLGATKALYLNRTDGQQTGTTFWNDTAPSSTLTTFGTSPDINSNGVTYVMYSWAEIAGFSKFGSYTGNGSSDGPFVYLGFRPRWVMWKNASAVSYWWIMDSSINPYNPNIYILAPNANIAEYTDSNLKLDFLSNGFKPRTLAGNEVNGSGNTIIYAAFAENPFKNANAR